MLALGVNVQTKENQKILPMRPGCAIAQLIGSGRPKEIQLRIGAEPRRGITSFVILGSKLHETDFVLTIQVGWRKQECGQWTPWILHRAADNANVILMESSGLHFRNIQVVLFAAPDGQLFIIARQIFRGWVRTISGDTRFIPSRPEYAYPGMDYAKTWPCVAGFLSEMAIGKSLPIPNPALWNPNTIPELDGWKRGWTAYFSPIGNTGLLIGEDHAMYRIGPDALRDVPGPIKLLPPMKGLYFQGNPKQGGKGYAAAKSIKIV